MADPFARIRVIGAEVVCYLQPGADCDLAALKRDVDAACAGCGSIEELQARVGSVAERHALEVEYHVSAPESTDAYDRVVSMGFAPRR